MRIGHGYDVHGFEDGDALVLGGVSIPYHKRFKAHSDGDVLLHALCDAILGALGEGDIGKHFPDTAQEFANIDSRILLRSVVELMFNKQYKIANCDLTIIAQQPKMAAHIELMRANIASDLGSSTDQVNVKATTTEKLGYIGREEGVAVHAVVLLESFA